MDTRPRPSNLLLANFYSDLSSWILDTRSRPLTSGSWVVLQKTPQSCLDSKEVKPVNPKGNRPWIFTERADAEAEAPILRQLMWTVNSVEKTPMLTKTEGKRRRGRQDEMLGWHHRLSGHEVKQTLEDCEGQGSLVCCCSWGSKELDTT